MSADPAAGKATATPLQDGLSSAVSDPTRLDAEQARIDAPTPAAPPGCHVARLGRDYTHGSSLFNAASFHRYRRKASDPLYRPLRVFLTDPVTSAYRGGIAVVPVSYEPLQAGPTGSYLAVPDGDGIRGKRVGLADLDSLGAMLGQGLRPSTADPSFHQQMVYAVCAEVAAAFTGALGRELSWGFDSGVLTLRPHYNEERNAYYDPESGELRFGYFLADEAPGAGVLPGGTIYTCLSHDIVAHEMTHAILDGMRRRFHDPTNPDVLAFHEGFADLVAILLHFSRPEAVRAAIMNSAGKLGSDATIFSLAEEFGEATGVNGPLRVALGDPAADNRLYGESEEPHERGSVLVSAIMQALARVFERRAEPVKTLIASRGRENAPIHPAGIDLLAGIATRTASQFLALCIRAIDYCPPVDIRFGEYLRALVTADLDLVEDDRDGFRRELIAAFAARKIFPDDVPDISEDALLWRSPDVELPEIPGLGFDVLQLRPDPGESPSRDEIAREAGALADVVTAPRYRECFGLSTASDAQPPTIESIRILRRVGPDRQVRFGLVCEIIQEMCVTVGDRRASMAGGSTVIMDGAGKIRFVIRKAADKENRALANLRFLDSQRGMAERRAADDGKTWAKAHAAYR